MTIVWQCSHCNRWMFWEWSEYDYETSTHMKCDACRKDTIGFLRRIACDKDNYVLDTYRSE